MDFLVRLFCTVLRYDNKTIIAALFSKTRLWKQRLLFDSHFRGGKYVLEFNMWKQRKRRKRRVTNILCEITDVARQNNHPARRGLWK